MARFTFLRQDAQQSSDVYNDGLAAGATLESAAVIAEDDFNALRSQVNRLLAAGGGAWTDDLVTPSALEAGAQRGANDLNDALHLIEKKRFLKCRWNLHSIAGGAGQAVTLAGGELPANTTAAVGAVNTLGTVVAQATVFGTASAADVVTGPTAIGPHNLVELVDAVSRDPILDAGDRIYGLLQSENGVDGHTITAVASDRVQISFVKISGGTALALITAGAMNGVNFDYCHVEQVRFEDLLKSDLLRGANVDVPGGTSVTRQAGYDNQGTTPVELTTNADLDLATGLAWRIRDNLDAVLLRVLEGSGGGTSEVQIGGDVDVFNVDAVLNDFDQGIRADTGGTRIDVGENAGVIETPGGTDDLTVRAGQELFLDDGNRTGSTWATAGMKLAETTAEWDALETEFGGELSLAAMLVAAAASSTVQKTTAVVTVTTAADTDLGGVGGGTNLDAQIHDLSGGNFITDHDFYWNGQLLRNGANAAANFDVYPGTSLPNGQFRLEFQAKAAPGNPSTVTVISRA